MTEKERAAWEAVRDFIRDSGTVDNLRFAITALLDEPQQVTPEYDISAAFEELDRRRGSSTASQPTQDGQLVTPDGVTVSDYEVELTGKLRLVLSRYVESEDGWFTFPDGERWSCKRRAGEFQDESMTAFQGESVKQDGPTVEEEDAQKYVASVVDRRRRTLTDPDLDWLSQNTTPSDPWTDMYPLLDRIASRLEAATAPAPVSAKRLRAICENGCGGYDDDEIGMLADWLEAREKR